VLVTTLLLLVGGGGCLWAFGLGEGSAGSPGFIGGQLFHSVTARTAGFNTVSVGAMPLVSVIVLVLLMFVGGSPGSCAGGIKTTSLAIGLARLKAALLGREEVVLSGRLIPAEVVLRATALTGLSLLWNGIGVLVLGAAQPSGVSLRDIVFEQVSAFATVGLSTGLTVQLTTVSRLWIICTMFVGRLGPLTVAFSFLTARRPLVGYPRGRVMIG
jgi:trk system potassium uptake protein TrkH